MSDKIKLYEDLKVLCCGIGPIKKGSLVTIYKQTSPNRLIINTDSGLHKVKASSFRRCTKIMENANEQH